MKSRKTPKTQKRPSHDELVAEIQRLRAVIAEAAQYPFQSINLHNILKKGLNEAHEEENRTTAAR